MVRPAGESRVRGRDGWESDGYVAEKMCRTENVRIVRTETFSNHERGSRVETLFV